jgi:SAM-dependent methyltransferase
MISQQLARMLIRSSQRTPFRGTGSYSELSPKGTSGFPQAETELAHTGEFFGFFRNPPNLVSKSVLDFGCGYGGRTVGYATAYGASRVVGVEPFAHVIEKCRAFAESRGVKNCDFIVNSQQAIPLPDSSIDVVVSYDVFEHVTDPAAMLSELRRILVPGGRAYIVFTPFYGAFSHHLNYITQLPGLHWVFDPRTLVGAVNSELRNGGRERFGTVPQPEPQMAFGGGRRSLPWINGVTGEEFTELCRDFEMLENHYTPLLERFRAMGGAGAWLNRQMNRLSPRIEEALSFNMVVVLENTHRPA